MEIYPHPRSRDWELTSRLWQKRAGIYVPARSRVNAKGPRLRRGPVFIAEAGLRGWGTQARKFRWSAPLAMAPAGPHRFRLDFRASTAEHHLEQVRRGVAGDREADDRNVDVDGRLHVIRLRVRHHGFEGAAAAFLQQIDHGRVAAIDVLAEFELAGVIHERGLVGNVDRDRRGQIDVDLAAAIHAADLLRRVVVLRLRDAEQRRGVLIRVLHAHAAMAERTLRLREQVLVRRVVLVDQELVREVEADAAERIGFAWRLRDVDGAIAVARELQAHALKHGGVLLQRRQVLIVDDRWRHIPCWIDGDVLHRLRQERRGMRARLAGDDARGPDRRAVVHDAQRVVGNVEDDISIAECGSAEIARRPAPALHVDALDVDLAVVLRPVQRSNCLLVETAGGLDVVRALELANGGGDGRVIVRVARILGEPQLITQRRRTTIVQDGGIRILLRRLDETQRFAVGDLGDVISLAAQLGELRLQFLEELVRRIVGLKGSAGVE